jgi:hypothetical protein
MLPVDRYEEAPMRSLPLAVKIADVVAAAKSRQVPLDVEAKAECLLKDHPEAETSRADIAETLREESAAIGAVLG